LTEEDDEVTALLNELAGGNQQALGELVPIVYERLRVIASQHMGREAPGHTLNPTAVVHEAYLRLAQLNGMQWQNRNHFYAIASKAMRRVLVNYAVGRNTQKRGGRHPHVELTDHLGLAGEDADGILALNEALERLEALDERQVRVVECRFFSGLNIVETAQALDISPATVKRDWIMARAWLNQALADD